MASFADALRQEIALLEAELARDPRYLKIERLRGVLDLYGSSGGGREAPDTVVARAVTRVPSESRLKALELAEQFLMGKTSPTPTREIWNYIAENGGEIGGQDPISNLSAMLSNAPAFQSNGRIGWTLTNSVVPVDPKVFADIANGVISEFDAAGIKSTVDEFSTTGEIPSDVDKQLLYEARRHLKRHLTATELSQMRTAFAQEIMKRSQLTSDPSAGV